MADIELQAGERVLWSEGPRRIRLRSVTYVVTDRRLVVAAGHAVWWWQLFELGTPVVARRYGHGAGTIVFLEEFAVMGWRWSVAPRLLWAKSTLWHVEEPDEVRDLVAEARKQAGPG